MTNKRYIEDITGIVDRFVNKQCAYCIDGILVSIQGMAEYKCNRCGKFIDGEDYLREIVKITSEYKKKTEEFTE